MEKLCLVKLENGGIYMKNKINIGCGNNYEEGWMNTEIVRSCKADAYFDAGDQKKDWPFADDTFEEMKACHVFEHLPDYDARMHFLSEAHRVCKKGAKIFLAMPYSSSGGAYNDLQHIRPFGAASFDYVSVNPSSKVSIMHDQEVGDLVGAFRQKTKIKFGNFYTKFLFLEFFANWWHTRHIYELLFQYVFMAQELHVWLEVVK